MHFDDEKNMYIIDDNENSEEAQKKRMRPKRPRFLLPLIMSLAAVVLVAVLLLVSGIAKPITNRVSALFSPTVAVVGSNVDEKTSSDLGSVVSDGAVTPDSGDSTSSGGTGSSTPNPVKISGATLSAGVEYTPDTTAATTIETLLAEMKSNGLSTVFLNLNYNGSLLCTAEGFKNPAPSDILQSTIAAAHDKGMSVMAVVNLSELSGGNITTAEAGPKLQKAIASVAKIQGLDGLLFSGAALQKEQADFSMYLSTGSMGGFDAYCRDKLSASVKSLCSIARAAKDTLYLGLVCDPIWAKDSTVEDGIAGTSAAYESYKDGHADTLSWIQKDYFDLAMVNVSTSTTDKNIPFQTAIKWWNEKTPATADLGFMMASDKVSSKTDGWSNPDQLTRQLMAVAETNRSIFTFNSYKALRDDKTGSTEAVFKYISGKLGDDYTPKGLTFSSPAKTTLTTYQSSIAIIGASDPEFPLTLDGKAVERTQNGFFSMQQNLKVGVNKLSFSHKGSTVTLNITYRYIVLKDISPSSTVTADGGSPLVVRATARTGSTVKATLNGSTITLGTASSTNDSDGPTVTQQEFSTYSGTFILPSGYKKNTAIGKITFSGTHNGVTESMSSGIITVKKEVANPGIVTDSPLGGKYFDVGNTLVAEVTKDQIETFDAYIDPKKIEDYSRPTNNYLPLGTIDYCSERTDNISAGKTVFSYKTWRYGKRTYISNTNGVNIKTYKGTVPDHNNISVKDFGQQGNYSVLTLKTDWKAPFLFDLLPQNYKNAAAQDYRIDSITYSYVDITFCYAASFNGTVDVSGNPIFSKAEIIKNKSDYTLRLYLKKTGAFYGWNAKYNDSGDLVFSFLNPATLESAPNKYGVSLNGIRIVVDAGHGGSDPGATAMNSQGKTITEAERALCLAQKVESQLKELGATVIMTRTSNDTLAQDTRASRVRNAGANLAVSIHRNAADNVNASAFNSFHFNAFTKSPAQYIYDATDRAGLYKTTAWSGIKFHYFYLSRITDCPVVLTENGYMTNASELEKITSDSFNDQCAAAIVEGVVNYFKAIQ